MLKNINNYLKKSFFFALIFFLLLISKGKLVLAQNLEFPAQEFTFTKTGPFNVNPGPVIGRVGTYDSAPTAIQEGDIVKVWYCGSENDRNSEYRGHDQIYYASYYADSGGIITPPMPVLWPSLNDTYDDGDMTCAVTVAKHKNPNIYGNGSWGGENYKMWYECAPIVYRKEDNMGQGAFTQICHAVSDDGITWHKWEDLSGSGGQWRYNVQSRNKATNTNATAVITIPNLIKTNIQLEKINGKFMVFFGDPNTSNNIGANNVALNYGVGHPSVVVSPPNLQGYQRIQLWYYDSQGEWGKRALMYVESYDGFNFSSPIKTNIQSPAKVKYMDITVGSHKGVYFSTVGGFHKSFFNYSWDGIKWFWTDQGYAEFYTSILVENFNLGTVTACSDFGNVTVSDKNGRINSLNNIRILSTEGGLGPYDGCNKDTCPCYNKVEDELYCYDTNSYVPLDQSCTKRGSRGDAWDIYSLIGNLTFSPRDLDNNGLVNKNDAVLLSQEILLNGLFGLIDLIGLVGKIK